MSLAEIKVSGRICIFLQELDKFGIDEFLQKGTKNYYSLLQEPSFRYYLLHLKKKDYSINYPILEDEEFLLNNLKNIFASRYNRLSLIAERVYYFYMKVTDADINEILNYSSQKKVNRVLIFHSNHLLRDEKRLLKIFKSNSFLYNREANFSLAHNLFNENGYIRKKKIESILSGEAKFAYDSTFRMIELELDQVIGSNISTIRYVKEQVQA